MKLEAAAGLRHLCSKDTPSLNISFPYAEADTGWTRSSLLTLFASLYVPALSEWFFAMKKGEKKEKCILGKGVLWVQTCQEAPDVHGRSREGKVPSLAGGVGHTHRHTHAMNVTTQVIHTSISMTP